MHCPRCNVEVLEERTRDGVTIDLCPSCRGVWLDRGELERLIARAAEPADERRRVEPEVRRDDGDRRGRPDDRRAGSEERRGGYDERRRRQDGNDDSDDHDEDDDDGPRERGGFFRSLRNLFD